MVNREIKARKRAVKEEKEEIDGEIVRIRKGHPRTNLPVKLPENPTWLKQPNVVTLMAGDFKTVQIRILIAVIEKLQNAIELSIQHLDKYGTSIPCEQLSLFQEYSDRIRVDIAYRDLGVNPDQYKEVKSMVRKLISIPVEFDVKDPITGEESWSITGLFTKANIPKTPYSRGFSLEMDREVAKVFINVDRGFTRYIKEIALRAQSRYTIRMKYALGDDQVMFYKMYCMGLKQLTWFHSGIKHLDAGTAMVSEEKEKMLIYSDFRFKTIFWHRFIYLSDEEWLSRSWSMLCIGYTLGFALFVSLVKGRLDIFKLKLKAMKDAVSFIKSEEYHILSLIKKNVR